MAFLDFFTGTPERTQQLPTLSPQQVALQQQLGQNLPNLLRGLTQGFNFEPIRQQAQRGFGQNISSLAERFTALDPSAQRSSAFQGALGQAASGLESDLASLQSRLGLQQQAQQQGLFQSLLGAGLSPSFENIYQQRQPGAIESGLSSLISLLPLFLLGGPAGAAAGAAGLAAKPQQQQAQPTFTSRQFAPTLGGGSYAPQAGLLSGLLSGLGGY